MAEEKRTIQLPLPVVITIGATVAAAVWAIAGTFKSASEIDRDSDFFMEEIRRVSDRVDTLSEGLVGLQRDLNGVSESLAILRGIVVEFHLSPSVEKQLKAPDKDKEC